MKVFKAIYEYLKEHIGMAALWAGSAVCFAVIFYLYDLPLEAVLYAALLSFCLLALAAVIGFLSFYRRHCALLDARTRITLDPDCLPLPRGRIEEDYAQLADIVLRDRAAEISKADAFRSDMTEYYTTWVHQIKTPLAAMRLVLQSGFPTEMEEQEYAFDALRDELLEELLKTEQYVDMALQYLRLDSESSDFVFREYDLDDIIRQAVRKFSGMFIRKRILLDYTGTGIRAVTDEKWLLFVIEQILSNALKYTSSGTISIYAEYSEAAMRGMEVAKGSSSVKTKPYGETAAHGIQECRTSEGAKRGAEPDDAEQGKTEGQTPDILVIADTGIGIASEDLNRVFEKGFTGYNGRRNKKSTGIGLYLSKRILDKLSHSIEIESEPGNGTKVKIGLNRYELKGE